LKNNFFQRVSSYLKINLQVIISKNMYKERLIMNNVVLVGRLTRDAEIVNLGNGDRKGIKFTLAVDRNYRNSIGEKEADFIPIIYFTNYCDKLISYLVKGKLVSVTGKIHVHSRELEDHTKKYYTDIEVEDIQFLASSRSQVI
jgi:single-strand DNA-binding protein